jgi:hypothetical protein
VLLDFTNLSALALLSFAAALTFLGLRLTRTQDAQSAGFLGSLAATFLGLSGGTGPSGMVYFSSSGLTLLISAVDISFSMAYLGIDSFDAAIFLRLDFVILETHWLSRCLYDQA